MAISIPAGSACFPNEDSYPKKHISKSHICGRGTHDQPASIPDAVATKPRRKSFPNAALLREDSGGISNPAKGPAMNGWRSRILTLT